MSRVATGFSGSRGIIDYTHLVSHPKVFPASLTKPHSSPPILVSLFVRPSSDFSAFSHNLYARSEAFLTRPRSICHRSVANLPQTVLRRFTTLPYCQNAANMYHPARCSVALWLTSHQGHVLQLFDTPCSPTSSISVVALQAPPCSCSYFTTI